LDSANDVTGINRAYIIVVNDQAACW